MLKVIISHQNLDFDGLASMVAASKLYPDAVMSYVGLLSHDVKRFVSLYKNVINIQAAGKIDLNKVEELIIVDVNTANRIGKYKDLVNKNIPITIYDHHEITSNSIVGTKNKILSYGACATILVNELKEKGIPITAFEATLLALGVYADTNCLTFSHTTYHDAEAVAFLLKEGANLSVITEFMSSNMDNQQNELFTKILLNLEEHEINGYKISITAVSYETFVGQLGTMCEKLMEIKNVDAVFIIVEMENKCHIVARSNVDEIHLPNILEEFGGGGHKRAASAVVKELMPKEVSNRLLEIMKLKIKSQTTAIDIMSYPVKTVFEDMTVEEVNKIMFRYGHTGMPVVKEDHLIGIISRTDIDKAMIHGLNHAPVKGFMRSKVMTISPDATISEINHILINNNIGRVPVVDNGKIIGIVTRTDILRVLHGKNAPGWYKKTYDEIYEEVDCKGLLKDISPEIYRILDIAGSIGDVLGIKVFVVGGFVRDLLLGTENWDIDLVVEGDGITFATELNSKLKGDTKLFQQFGTAIIQLGNGQTIDIVTARREYYEYPAALPKIEKSSIWSDLFRRDFTINCMAIQLNKLEEGKLIDYFGGLSDIRNKKIRVLYNLSFIEDPTRIFRGIRFASRFNFEIEEETKKFIKQAIQQGMIEKLSKDRIRDELLHIIKEKNLENTIILMENLNIFKEIHPLLTISQQHLHKVSRIDETISQYDKIKQDVNRILVIIMVLLRDFPTENLEEIISLFSINKNWATILKTTLSSRIEVYNTLNNENLDRFRLFVTLEPLPPEAIVYYHIDCENPFIKHYLLLYILKLKGIRPSISGEDLRNLGIKPGPIYGFILEKILEEKVLGNIYSYDDEILLAKKLIPSKKGDNHA